MVLFRAGLLSTKPAKSVNWNRFRKARLSFSLLMEAYITKLVMIDVYSSISAKCVKICVRVTEKYWPGKSLIITPFDPNTK